MSLFAFDHCEVNDGVMVMIGIPGSSIDNIGRREEIIAEIGQLTRELMESMAITVEDTARLRRRLTLIDQQRKTA